LRSFIIEWIVPPVPRIWVQSCDVLIYLKGSVRSLPHIWGRRHTTWWESAIAPPQKVWVCIWGEDLSAGCKSEGPLGHLVLFINGHLGSNRL
jgi:hypothetical protein